MSECRVCGGDDKHWGEVDGELGWGMVLGGIGWDLGGELHEGGIEWDLRGEQGVELGRWG